MKLVFKEATISGRPSMQWSARRHKGNPSGKATISLSFGFEDASAVAAIERAFASNAEFTLTLDDGKKDEDA